MLNGYCYVILVLCVFRKTHEPINIISILRKLDLPHMVKRCNLIDITIADTSTASTNISITFNFTSMPPTSSQTLKYHTGRIHQFLNSLQVQSVLCNSIILTGDRFVRLNNHSSNARSALLHCVQLEIP